jgi:asparagine synthase (glutamine-hydrolysing)
MCGIAGIVDRDAERPPEEDLVRAMAGLLAHRGPDDEGFHLEPGAALGMRRLSIIDVAGGRQPVYAEDGRVGVVFNGEIYNHLGLRAGLEARGHIFKTRADTEVIVHGYEVYGDAVVERLHGMFALAVWDGRRRRLLLARDRLGKKPLHYAVQDGRLLFASEIKALLLAPGVSRALDLDALDDYVAYGYVLGPRTIFRDVRRLPPGHVLVWEEGRVRIERYWDVTVTGEDRRPAAELVEELRALLDEAVRVRLMSDVPLGAFLSGGLDSSAVVALMSRHLPGPVKTFSIGFDDPDFDELVYARAVAARYGTDHHEFVVRPDMVEDLPRIVWQLDEPFADDSAIPTYYVAQMARGQVAVVLTGDGGDESFGGYPRYLDLAHDPLAKYLPPGLRAIPLHRLVPAGVHGHDRLRRMRLPAAERYAEGLSIFPAHYRTRLYAGDLAHALRDRDARPAYAAYFDGSGDAGALAGAQTADLHRYLPDDILVKVDRMTMLASLEARCPLLDHRVVEFMARVPADLKIQDGDTKILFKRAVAPLLPEMVAGRGKMGFSVPLGRWFRGGLRGFMAEVLLSPRFAQRGLFRPELVRTLIRQQRAGAGRHQRRLWTLLCFELWARLYLDGDGWRSHPGQRPPSAESSRAAVD